MTITVKVQKYIFKFDLSLCCHIGPTQSTRMPNSGAMQAQGYTAVHLIIYYILSLCCYIGPTQSAWIPDPGAIQAKGLFAPT